MDALQLKKVDLHSVAIALASIVFPFPGGPYKRIPFEGASSPLKISGLMVGRMMVSFKICFTSARPLMSSQCTLGELSRMVSSIDLTICFVCWMASALDIHFLYIQSKWVMSPYVSLHTVPMGNLFYVS